MPKMKTHRGAKKRFKRTGTGKWIHRRANRSHLMLGKSPSRKRRLRLPATLQAGDAQRLRRLLPYA
jgi:large subunit ribosomal protein L35